MQILRTMTSTGSHMVVAAIIAGLSITFSSSSESLAQTFPRETTTPREVVIGVSKTTRTGAQTPTAKTPTVEVDATAAYQSASTLLRSGDIFGAQRALELLVARFPDTEGAARARTDLATLYNMNAGGRLQASLPGAEQISRLGRTEVQPPTVQPTISAWRTSIRPSTGFQKSAQDELRASAGDLVFFSEGSAELGARARKALAQQAAWLKQHPDRAALIEGHADESGNASDLKALSVARAQAVRNRLIEDGVAPDRLSVVAHGNERRIALCEDQSCAGQNRRVVTTVTTTVAGLR